MKTTIIICGDAGLVEMSTLAEITILNDAAAISQLTSDLSVNMAEVEAVTDERPTRIQFILMMSCRTRRICQLHQLCDTNIALIIVNYQYSGSDTFLTNLIISGNDDRRYGEYTPHVNIIITSGQLPEPVRQR